MMITPELKHAVDQAGEGPVRVEDPDTNRSFVLISAEQFDRMCALLNPDPVEQMNPYLGESFGEGWADPELDVYLDPRKS